MKDILGNDSLKNHLISSVRQRKISHAYILEGEKGSGKKKTASAFAALLQCEQAENIEEACGECTSCIMMKNKNHPDVIWVTHDKPGVISVGEIRQQVINTVEVKPYKGPYKIYIIDEAEKMNQAAQNAILKTIEEPPEYAVILLLTTNRGAFLPTILSRCIILTMKPVADEDIRKYLKTYCDAKNETIDFCVGFAMGNIGKAWSAAVSEDFSEMRDTGMSILKYFHDLEKYEIVEKTKELKKWKDNIQEYLDIMLIWFRDILVLKALKEEKYLIFQLEYEYLKKQSERLHYEDLNEIFSQIYQTGMRIRANVNFDTSMELLHIEIKKRYSKGIV